MSTSYSVTVDSPCDGDQTIDENNSSLYQGSVGDFSLVVLALDSSSEWVLTVYDYGNPSGSCFPYVQFGQVTPDSSDPTGAYGLLVGGSPDTSAGEASIT